MQHARLSVNSYARTHVPQAFSRTSSWSLVVFSRQETMAGTPPLSQLSSGNVCSSRSRSPQPRRLGEVIIKVNNDPTEILGDVRVSFLGRHVSDVNGCHVVIPTEAGRSPRAADDGAEGRRRRRRARSSPSAIAQPAAPRMINDAEPVDCPSGMSPWTEAVNSPSFGLSNRDSQTASSSQPESQSLLHVDPHTLRCEHSRET